MRRVKISCLIFLLLFPLFTWAESANISAFVFTTEPRTVAIGAISDALTVQTQNSEGVAEKVDETNDVTFSTTSGTGEFLGSTGNPVTTTMSKNTSSRTFYYRDQTNGTYTLTIKIKGRDSGREFTASQKITVGSGGSEGAGNTDTNTDNGTGSTTEGDSTSDTNVDDDSPSGTDTSSHSSPVSLSTYKKKTTQNFKIDAGRKRLVTVNTPVEFLAHASTDTIERSAKYSWSFGDGSMVGGREAEHVYMFPGTYNVVLNAEFGESESVARTEVVVVEPSFSLEKEGFGEDGYVEIKNNDKTEVNLAGWILSNGNEALIFAPDTIISGGRSITFPFPHFKEDARLFYPNRKELVLKKKEMNKNVAFLPVTVFQDDKKSVVVENESSTSTIPVDSTEEIKSKIEVATSTLEKSEEMGNHKNAALLIEAVKKEEEEDSWADRGWRFLRDILNR